MIVADPLEEKVSKRKLDKFEQAALDFVNAELTSYGRDTISQLPCGYDAEGVSRTCPIARALGCMVGSNMIAYMTGKYNDVVADVKEFPGTDVAQFVHRWDLGQYPHLER